MPWVWLSPWDRSPSAIRQERRTPPQSIISATAAGSSGDDSSFSPDTIQDTPAPENSHTSGGSAGEPPIFDESASDSEGTTDSGAEAPSPAGVDAPNPNASDSSAPDSLTANAGNTEDDELTAGHEEPTSDPNAISPYESRPLYATYSGGIALYAVNATYGTANSASYASALGGITSGSAQNDFTFMGRYQFNICGNTNVRGKGDSSWGTALHANTSWESTGYTLAQGAGLNLPTKSFTNNSSSSTLAQRTSGSKIVKAFLVVDLSVRKPRLTAPNSTGLPNPLANFGVCLRGPRGTINRYFPTRVYHDNITRNATFFDVTSFVQSQGYGTYTGINIPYSRQGETGNFEAAETGIDLFGAWKLIVIEEVPSLPVRMLRLRLGGTSVESTSPASVEVSGPGLYVAPSPTGECLVSMAGTDPSDSYQYLQYRTDKYPSNRSISTPLRASNRFFNQRIDINGSDVAQSPGRSTSSAYMVDTSTRFQTCNTDLSINSINRTTNANDGSMRLNGGESSATLLANTSNAPTILTALGLAIDVVMPKFNTTITISDLDRNWSTADPGYDASRDYAFAGDRIRATMISTNVSDQQNLGIQGGTATLTLPAFASIDKSTVVARFRGADGKVTNLTNVTISGNTLTCSTTSAVQVRKGGYFEVVCEGIAAGGNAPASYENSCSLSGTFVDSGAVTRTGYHIDGIGVASATSTSDGERHVLSVASSGPGAAGVTKTATALPATGPYTTTANLYGSDTGHAAWRAEEGAHVAFVMVDGQVRCDLEGADRVSVPMDGVPHQVYIAFAAGEAPDKGEAPFTVTTVGDEGLTFLTPTATDLAAGSSHEVTWDVAAGYQIAEVKVDGVPIPSRSTEKVAFDQLAGNHAVTVRTAPVPAERLAVRTTVVGPGSITPASTVSAGQSYPVSWSGTVNGAILNYVKVNGVTVFDKNKDLPTQAQTRPGSTSALPADVAALFSNIQADVAIEVCYIDPGRTPETPAPYKVVTQLMGGAGSVTPTLTVAPGGAADLSWKPASGWEVAGVTVIRGDSRIEYAPTDAALSSGGLGIALDDVRSDCLVEVTLRRGIINVVTENAGAGTATLTPTLKDVKPGSTPVVEWSVPEGSHIKAVIVDGVVRDDLLDAGRVEFPNVQEGHTVTVVTATDAEEPDDPREPEEGDLYRIDVTCEGAGTAGPAALVRGGTSHAVSWTGEGGAPALSITVDGVERPELVAAGSVDFKAIGANHRVHVVFAPFPDDTKSYYVETRIQGGPGTIGGCRWHAAGTDAEATWTVAAGYRVKSVTVDGEWRPELTGATTVAFPAIDANHTVLVELEEDLWRVDVSYTGSGTAGQSATVGAGDTHRVTWEPKGAAGVLAVIVDGEERSDLLDAGEVSFDDIRAHHTVHVVFDQDPPDDDQWRRVDIALIGGEGEASGSGRVPVGSSHEVTWKAAPGWRVAAVTVDGEERPDLVRAGSVAFEDIRENHSVVVRLEEATLDATLSLETYITGGAGAAAITPGENGIPLGESRTVRWTVPPGWHVASVTVDGVARDDLLRKGTVIFPLMTASHRVVVALAEGDRDAAALYQVDVTCDGAGTAGPSALVAAGRDHLVTWQGAAGTRPIRIEVDGIERPDLLDAGGIPFHTLYADHTVHVVFPEGDRDDLCTVRTSIVGGAGTITGTTALPPGSDAVVEWAAAAGYRVKSVTVDGVAQDASATRWGFSSIAGDHEVVVEVELALWRVNVTWEGQGSAGPSALVRPGADAQVTWAPDTGRQVLRVEVDGADRPELVDAGVLNLTGIDRDHTVHVVFDRDPAVEAWHRVDVVLTGGPGTVSGSGEVAQGADAQVTWAPAPGFAVSRVTVDGEERPDLLEADDLWLRDIQGDHRVEVELAPVKSEPPEPDPETPDDPDGPDDPDDPDGPDGPDEPEGPDNGDGNGDPSGPDDGSGNGSGTGDRNDGSGDGSGGDGDETSDGDGSNGGEADDGGSANDGDGRNVSDFATALHRLAQTGDLPALLMPIMAIAALLSGATLLSLRRRRRG